MFRCFACFYFWSYFPFFYLCVIKKISQAEIGDACFALGAALRLVSTFEVKHPSAVNKGTLTFSDICHEGAMGTWCRHSSRCQNTGQDVCGLCFVQTGYHFCGKGTPNEIGKPPPFKVQLRNRAYVKQLSLKKNKHKTLQILF